MISIILELPLPFDTNHSLLQKLYLLGPGSAAENIFFFLLGLLIPLHHSSLLSIIDTQCLSPSLKCCALQGSTLVNFLTEKFHPPLLRWQHPDLCLTARPLYWISRSGASKYQPGISIWVLQVYLPKMESIISPTFPLAKLAPPSMTFP